MENNKIIKPFYTLAFACLVAGFLVGLGMFFPAGKLSLAGHELKVFSLAQIYNQTPVVSSDISGALALGMSADSSLSDSTLPADSSALGKAAQAGQTTTQADSIRKDPPLFSLGLNYRIQNQDSLQPALAGFFEQLDSLSIAPKLIRIWHIGDSQIEGDRITSFLRHRFQKQFGGCGVGLVPVFEANEARQTIYLKSKGPWAKYAAFGTLNKPKHKFLGPFAAYFKFANKSSAPKDSTKNDSTKAYPSWASASASYRFSGLYYPKNKIAQQIKVLFRNPTPFELSFSSGILKEKTTIEPHIGLGSKQISLPADAKGFELKFSASKSPEILGVCIDCSTGVAFDNIPLRGSSGLEFSRYNTNFMAAQLDDLQVKLLVLQFGVNVVPNVVADYGFYEKMFYNQLMAIRKASPNIHILVVGLSDMSKKVDGGYESYSNITAIRDVQQKAAFRAGCAFWDLYTAMGGQNSMVEWVSHKPALAAKDYTHFSPRGAQIVAEMLYKAISHEHNRCKILRKAKNSL